MTTPIPKPRTLGFASSDGIADHPDPDALAQLRSLPEPDLLVAILRHEHWWGATWVDTWRIARMRLQIETGELNPPRPSTRQVARALAHMAAAGQLEHDTEHGYRNGRRHGLWRLPDHAEIRARAHEEWLAGA